MNNLYTSQKMHVVPWNLLGNEGGGEGCKGRISKSSTELQNKRSAECHMEDTNLIIGFPLSSQW